MKENDKEETTSHSFLTPRQISVLKLREEGLSQQEIAEMLGTTRSNVSILEKRALQNVERARDTLRDWMAIKAPISIKVQKGTDVFEIPGQIFKEADKMGLRIPLSSVDLITKLRTEAVHAFRGRMVSQEIEIFVSENGEVLVQVAKNQV